MNQTVETIIKAVLILAGVLGVGSGMIKIFDEKTIALVAAAIASLVTVGIDVFSTYRLKQQGIVSTDPVANVAALGTPAKLVATEKAEARAEAKAEADASKK